MPKNARQESQVWLLRIHMPMYLVADRGQVVIPMWEMAPQEARLDRMVAKMEIMEIIQVHMELKMVDLELLVLHMDLGLQHLLMEERELVVLPMIELELIVLPMVILEPVLRMEALLMELEPQAHLTELEGADIPLDLPRVRTHKPRTQMVKTQTLGMDRMLALRR